MTLPQRVGSVALSDVIDAWPAIVGPDVAARCRFASFTVHGALSLWVRSHDLRRELVTPEATAAVLATLPPVIDNVPVTVLRFDVPRAGDV